MVAPKSTETEFTKVVEASTNWPEALRVLRNDYGYSDERSIKRRAIRLGIKPSGSGFKIIGKSTLYDDEGNVKLEWVKTSEDKEQQLEILKSACQGFLDNIRGKSKHIPEPADINPELLAVYIQPEPHLGMYSWGAETGDDYDCDIAKNLLKSGTERLVDAAPAAEHALIVDVSDWFHADNKENKTMQAGNQLDVDTRWPRVCQVGASIRKYQIELALTKHKTVHVKYSPGNHDEHTSFMLAMITAAYFEDNPRVIVDLQPSMYKYHTFGKNLIGIHHGDKSKPEKLPLLMAADQREAWGTTEFRYWYTGHIHHKTLHEFPGCLVESFRSIAAKDSWHAGKGYRSGRDMQMLVLHKNYGEIERHTVGLAQLQGGV